MARALHEMDGIHPPLGGIVESSQKSLNFTLPKVKYQAIKVWSSCALPYNDQQTQGKYIFLLLVRTWRHPVIPPMRTQAGAARLHYHSAGCGERAPRTPRMLQGHFKAKP
jgi:hypothetical protein